MASHREEAWRQPVILLDTNILLQLEQVQLPPGEYGLSSLVYAELRLGVESATEPSVRRARLQDIARAEELVSRSWLPFDERAADGYAFLAARVLRTRPAHARSKDVMIAGHAYALGARIATLNPKDFALVTEHVEIVVPERIR